MERRQAIPEGVPEPTRPTKPTEAPETQDASDSVTVQWSMAEAESVAAEQRLQFRARLGTFARSLDEFGAMSSPPP